MAQGDSVADSQTTSGNGITLQPAAGDEWMLTDIGATRVTATLRWNADANKVLFSSLFRADSRFKAPGDDFQDWALVCHLNGMKMMITNSNYIEIYDSTADFAAWWTGVKLKD